MLQRAPAGPPRDSPELPDAARPSWPPWYGFAAMGLGTVVVTVVAFPLLPLVLFEGVEGARGALALLVLLVVQDAAYLGTAVWFASRRSRPTAWQFGLRRVPFVRTALITLGVCLAVLGFELGFTELTGLEDDTEDLTSSGSVVAAVAVSLAVIVVAPVTEELFFRAFVYRSLRNRLKVWSAALVDGAVFASVHLQYLATPEALLIIAVFGVAACLLYEATGSVFPPIALHAAFNTLALAGTNTGYAAPIAVGALVLAGCVLAPRLLAPAPSPLRS